MRRMAGQGGLRIINRSTICSTPDERYLQKPFNYEAPHIVRSLHGGMSGEGQ